MEERLYFNEKNSSDLTDRIFFLIKTAKRYIKTGNFFFKDPKLHEALIEAAERGVAIFVLSNLTGNERERTTKEDNDPHIPNLHELNSHGVHVRLCKELHAKFLISDGLEGIIMSANYTRDSLYGNPENGVDIKNKELSDLELIFDLMYLSPDTVLIGNENTYGYKDRNNPINPDRLEHIGKDSRLRMTAASITNTNLSLCNYTSIYESIINIIKNSEDAILIVSWSYNQINKLPELKNAIKEAINRGVKVSLFYGDKATPERIERTRRNALELIGEENKSQLIKFSDNHAKCIISEKEGFLFTSNIDGYKGLLEGFELGCILTEKQRLETIKRISQIISHGK